MQRQIDHNSTKYHAMNVFGVISIVMLVLVNLGHLIWTVWLIVEQIQTGWGYGTNIELAALLPWLTELLCIPAIVTAVVYLVLSCFFRHKKGILIANILLFTCAMLQFGVTNLFMWI